jgi:hypothetical protein
LGIERLSLGNGQSLVVLHNKSRRTKRALDAGDSARFTSIFLASGFLCSQAESTPAPAPVTQTVRCYVQNQEQIQEQRQVPHYSKVYRLAKIFFKRWFWQVFLFLSLWFWLSNCRVFKFSFVFSIFGFAVGRSFG